MLDAADGELAVLPAASSTEPATPADADALGSGETERSAMLAKSEEFRAGLPTSGALQETLFADAQNGAASDPMNGHGMANDDVVIYSVD